VCCLAHWVLGRPTIERNVEVGMGMGGMGMSYREQYGNGNGFSNVQITEMGMGRTLREWEGLGMLKTIPAHF